MSSGASRAPPHPALGAHQVRAGGLDPIQTRRVEDCAVIGQGLSALGVSSSPNRQLDPLSRRAAHEVDHFLHAPRRGHCFRHPPGHPSEVEGACLPLFQVADRTREEMFRFRHRRVNSS